MVVATRAVETATTSSAPVVVPFTRNGPTAGTVSAGGAITGGRVCADVPTLGDGDGAETGTGGEPDACETTAVAGRDVGRGAGAGVRFDGAAGVGCGETGGGAWVQQWPSPWWSCDHRERQ
jgi:hypothetical protein